MRISFINIIPLMWTLFLFEIPSFSQDFYEPSLIIAYDTNWIEPDGYNIAVLYQADSNRLYKFLNTVNLPEYFKYLGQIYPEDGNKYHLFEDYSLPAGLSTLFYFNLSNYTVYQIGKIKEFEYPLYFSFNSKKRNVNIISRDINDCGEIHEKLVNKIWNMNDYNQEALSCLPPKYEILLEIPLLIPK